MYPVSKSRTFTLVIALALVLSVAGAGVGVAEANSLLQEAQKRGFVFVGFANEAPYAYATPEGTLTGVSVEVARAVLKKLGIDEMYGVLVPFAALIPGLQAGRFDMVTAGMSIRPERCLQVAFADPDITYGTALAVKTGNPLGLYSYDDIVANPNVRVAVVAGGEEPPMLRAYGIRENQMVVVPDNPSMVDALRAGRVDAAAGTYLSLKVILDALGNPPDVEIENDFQRPIIDGNVWQSYGAVAFRKGDDEFREAFNAALKELKESGALVPIVEQFGWRASDIPFETADQICSR